MRCWLPLLVAAGCDVSNPFGPSETVDPGPSLRIGDRTVPIYGGTMTTHGVLTVAADPVRDLLVFEGVRDRNPSSWTVPLSEGSEPFRVAITDDLVYTTLRGTGWLLAHSHDGELVASAEVCDHPRGVASETGGTFVACAGGELLQLDPTTLEIQRQVLLEPDLRDVVFDGPDVLVSRFRAAEVLRVRRADLRVTEVIRPDLEGSGRRSATPRVAWRMVKRPLGGAMFVHQSHTDAPIDLEDAENPNGGRDGEGAYGGSDCFEDPTGAEDDTGPLVESHITEIDEVGAVSTSGSLFGLTSAIDLALSPSGSFAAVVGGLVFESATAVVIFDSNQLFEPHLRCAEPSDFGFVESASSVVMPRAGQWMVYNREAGWMLGEGIDHRVQPPAWFVDVSAQERLFQLPPPRASIACASCHPEAQDDGHTWLFTELGPRRTQNLSGGLTNRGTFHWDSEFDSLDGLMEDVFTGRMSGPPVPSIEVDALGRWLDGVAPVPGSSDASASELDRGKDLFESPTVGCTACHSGPQLSDHRLHQIATGAEPTKTPSLLGVGTRAPYMHTGCADTLLDRLTDEACGGDLHGDLTGLTTADLRALAEYLRTL